MSYFEDGGWFPKGRNLNDGWRLDIVSLLAVIGESIMEYHSQKMTASRLCFLPRLMPAPQGLLRTERPRRLPPIPGVTVYGAFSGTRIEELNYVANLVHKIEDLEPYQFQEFKIEISQEHREMYPLIQPPPSKTADELEAARDGPYNDDYSDDEKEDGPTDRVKEPGLEGKTLSLEKGLTVFSFLITVGLLVWSFLIHDAVACLSIAIMSVATTCTGLAFKWKPSLSERKATVEVPEADMVIMTRSRAFVVVHCDEEVARSLYTGPEIIEYQYSDLVSKAFVGSGTLCFMVAVVLLGNCGWTMQAAVGAAYLILNGVYWLASLVEDDKYWELKKYVVTNQTKRLPKAMRSAHIIRSKEAVRKNPELDSCLTRTLWYAIKQTKSISWVERMGAMPQTAKWNQWLKEAEKHIDNPRPWKPVSEKNFIFGIKPAYPPTIDTPMIDAEHSQAPGGVTANGNAISGEEIEMHHLQNSGN